MTNLPKTVNKTPVVSSFPWSTLATNEFTVLCDTVATYFVLLLIVAATAQNSPPSWYEVLQDVQTKT